MGTETKLYNADAQQHVALTMVVGGEQYDVRFLLNPITDDEAISFVDDPDSDSAKLFKKHVVLAEGCADEDGNEFTPEVIGQTIPLDDQRYAVDAGLMGTRFLPAPKSGRKLNLRQLPEVAVHKLAAYFDGEEIVTEHQIIPGTADHDRVYSALLARKFPVKFGDHEIRSYGNGLVKLYDALACKAIGYVGDQVPAFHKMAIVVAHFNGQRQIVMGK